MNRIVLIGNGFDLAHGLKTIYADLLIGIGKNGESDCIMAKANWKKIVLTFRL